MAVTRLSPSSDIEEIDAAAASPPLVKLALQTLPWHNFRLIVLGDVDTTTSDDTRAT